MWAASTWQARPNFAVVGPRLCVIRQIGRLIAHGHGLKSCTILYYRPLATDAAEPMWQMSGASIDARFPGGVCSTTRLPELRTSLSSGSLDEVGSGAQRPAQLGPGGHTITKTTIPPV